MSERLTGVVEWFSGVYGFIKQDGELPDVFVHQTQIDMGGYRKLEAGQKVSYELGENHKGPMAVNVKAAEDAAETED